jgi:DNA-binding NtrC family response regulator
MITAKPRKGNERFINVYSDRAREPADLVFSDVIIPGTNGTEMIKKIRKTRPEIKTLFMYGYTTNVIARHGILERGGMFFENLSR